jgi:hypothetical protein
LTRNGVNPTVPSVNGLARWVLSDEGMRNLIRVGLVLVGLVGSATIAQAGPIVNGGFEDPDCGVAGNCTHGQYTLQAAILGWTSSVDLIEVGEATLYGITGYEGDQVLELDANNNATVAQIVAGPGAFMLQFLYADRADGAESSTFEVYWNNVLLTALAPANNGGGAAMSLFSAPVIALGGPNTLTFVGTGPSNSYGALIDDVQLNAVPDGGLTALLLGVGVVGLRFVRRMSS